MTQIVGKVLALAGVAVIAGCSSTKQQGTIRVAHDSGYSATPYDRSYTPPAYDRGVVVTEVPEMASTRPAPRATMRPVSMVNTSSRYDITLDEMRGHVRGQSAIIVDARQPKDFKKGHVHGAVNIPAGDEDAYFNTFRREVAPEQMVIVYCGGPDCPAGDNVSTYLTSQGFTNLRVYKPGWQQLSKTDLH